MRLIIVKIFGGLGNQMFQSAFARAMEINGHRVKLDISDFKKHKYHSGYELNKLNLEIEVANSIELFVFRILKKTSINYLEESLSFDNNVFKIKGPKYFQGYFQNEKYFKEYRDEIIKQFQQKIELTNYSKDILLNIRKIYSCSVHIRRGDYINDENINIHGVCNVEYYSKAINFVKKNSKSRSVYFYVFSDDIEWCKRELDFPNLIFVEGNKSKPYEDLFLMSNCNYNIIANSTFSWWSAWLNINPDKIVIAPKRWFASTKLENQSTDIVCNDWIKL